MMLGLLYYFHSYGLLILASYSRIFFPVRAKIPWFFWKFKLFTSENRKVMGWAAQRLPRTWRYRRRNKKLALSIFFSGPEDSPFIKSVCICRFSAKYLDYRFSVIKKSKKHSFTKCQKKLTIIL